MNKNKPDIDIETIKIKNQPRLIIYLANVEKKDTQNRGFEKRDIIWTKA
jgi:hypothetical protein